MRQRILLLCIGLVSYLYCVAQNNDCSTPTPIITLDGTCVSGSDNTLATTDVGPSSCTGGSNNNLWYTFIAQGVSAQINVPNGPGAAEITLLQWSGAPCVLANLTEIDCANGPTLEVDNVLTIGNTYYVMIAFASGVGPFDICIDNPVPASNDNCVTATPLSNIDGLCTTYNNNFPSTDVLIPGCFTGSTYNVWFSFVAQGVSLDVSIPVGGPGVGQMAVIDFATNCNITGAVVLGCAVNAAHIVLDNQLTIGQTYYIVVGFQNSSFSAGTGNFDLCVDNPIPAVNDDCNDAITIPPSVLSDPNQCFDVINGVDVNNDFPSTDVSLFACWNMDDSYNVWYTFVAQGNDVEILVDPVFNNCDAQIALVEFTGNPCDIVGEQALDCVVGTVLDFNDDLVIGNTYFIAVGFENNCYGDFCMNVFDPVPPDNDLPCDAEVLPTNGNCVNGTTIYANPEGFPLPTACQSAISNTVWYSISMADPNNVGYTIDLSLDDVGPNTTVTVAIYEVTDCNTMNNLVFFNCGAPPTMPIEFGPVDETATYYIMVATSEPNETDFEICVDEIPPCFMNDVCEMATPIDPVVSDQAFICVDGCNLFADPEGVNNNCGIGDFSTVWFQVNTDGNATLMNINVQSDDFDAPTITLFQSISGDCSNIQNVGLTQSNLACITGSQGEAEALGSNVGANQTYYIAVSSLNSVGGEFTICVNTISQASACVSSSQIQITGRSGGGPLTGPFFPGETVSICMNVNSYTAAGNGCQWFQGMIPIFGNGWDPSSFDANGQPIGATVNGNNMGVAGNGLYGASTWDWFDGVGYHHDNIFFQVGDLDGNGTVEMCNILYDVNCPNLGGITGGCCGPCWANAGDPLPPGWFAYGINGTCPTPGPPISVDWGDGNSCGGGMGPWHFCFDLNVRDYPDCLTDQTTMDLSLGFFTTADGETGSWIGGPSVCALDQPLSLGLPMCCSLLTEEEQEGEPICSGSPFVYSIDVPGVDFWTWTFAGGGDVTGGSDGQGGPGTLIIATLFNNGSTTGIGEYTFLGFAGGACPVYRIVLTVDVYAQIMATLDPLVMCSTPTNPYIIGPDVTGGSGAYDYIWSNSEITPTISIGNPTAGTTYTVTVSDDVGCLGTASFTPQVYTTFPVDILAPVTEQCLSDGPITLETDVNGDFPPFVYEWTTPGGPFTTPDIMSSATGQHLVIVTDAEGCVGKDSLTIILDESPAVTIQSVNGIPAICAGNTTPLTAVGSEGETPYIYDWDTPEGPDSGKDIMASSPGPYTVTIEDNNGCTSTAQIEVELQPSPVPDLGPDLLLCNFDEIVEITPTETYDDYIWSSGAPASNGLNTIGIQEPGNYSVTVTNEFGCTGETDIEVSIYPVTLFPMPDTFKICAGATVTVDGNDYGGPWDYFLWDQCGSCQCCGTFPEGDYSVTAYDDNGCSATQDFTVASTISLSPNLQGPNIICAGHPITLTANPGFTTYDWSVPGASNTILVSTPGTYSVTVTDNVGCTGEESLTVASGDFTATITGAVSICSGIQSVLNAGQGFASYQWSTTATTDTVHVNAGAYSVTVTNSDGCTSVANVNVVETPFLPQITGAPIICQTSETSTLNAGGPYLNYQWSANAGSATTQTVNVSTAGTYSVTVTDISTCVSNTSFTVTNHPVPPVTITGSPDFCVGGNTQMTATAGYPNYIWNTTEPTATITINTAGPYTVTITDANGCTNTAETIVNPPFQETVQIIGSFQFCPGDSATLAVPLGYTSINWSTGDVNVNQIETDFEGIVSVTVVDPGGCIAMDDQQTISSATLSPVISGDTAICDNGTAVLDAGPGFDLYQWSGSLGTTQTVSVNAPGIYAVTVSSLSGCVGDTTFEVSQYPSPFAVVTPTATACDKQEPGGPTTIVNFNSMVTSGDQSGNWTFVSGPSAVNISNPANVNFNGLPTGTYTFTYTTNSAVAPCIEKPYNLVVTVNSCACPVVSVGLAPDLCNDLGTVDLSTIVTGMTGGVWTIISSPPGANPATISAGHILDAAGTVNPGTYTLQYVVSGLASYCTSSVTTTVNVMRTPVAGVASAPAQFCAGENQTVSLSTLLVGADTGGQWNESSANPSTGNAFDPVTGKFLIVSQAPGIYTFDYIVNGPGPCPDDQVTVQVEIENNPVADAGATATLDCNASTTVLGGSGTSTGPEFDYNWVATNGGNLNDPNIIDPIASSGGTYTLTVMNTLTGCTATDQVIINQIGTFPSEIELDVKSPDCPGDPAGSVQVLNVVGGVNPYNFSLDGGPFTPAVTYTNLTAGDHQIETVDGTGCKLTESFTIEAQVNVDLAIVNFVHDSLVFALGDTIRFSYLYSGSSNTPDSLVWKIKDSVLCINCTILEIVADLASTVTLEAYDVRGCKITKSVSFLVVRIRDVYIPNVFSPNGDNINDYFTLFTKADVKEITLLEVFSRWGDLVFRKTNFKPNIPEDGWDGTFRNQALNPGVYVYRIEIIYGDDLEDKLSGDITIIR